MLFSTRILDMAMGGGGGGGGEGEENIDCVTGLGAGTNVLRKPAFRFSQFYLSKAVFMYIVRSPRFIPSPCFIPAVRGPQSAVHSSSFILTT